MTPGERPARQEMAMSPVKSTKEGCGKAGCELGIGRAVLKPGGWLYGDSDGVLNSEIECR